MKIITWNINSIRLRIDNLTKIINQENPDVICLQECKVINELFPTEIIKSLGYNYLEFEGEKSYNGVAILSKLPFIDQATLKFVNNDARHLSVILNNEIELHNFYIPAGGDEPDPEINDKFKHKLDYCDYIANWFKKNRNKNDKIILVGDLNIAPLENDVWSHKQLQNVVSHTAIEIEKMNKIFESIEFIDAVRKFTSADQKLYSWWSYRNKDWKKSNRGRRLDHIFITKILEKNLTNSYIIKNARDFEKPSDHVPVVSIFKFD